MADTTNDEMTFTIYALGDTGADGGKSVPADIFVRKLQEFLEAFRESDRSANSGLRHEYLIANLKKGSAQVTFAERPLPSVASMPVRSSFRELEGCIDAIFRNDIAAAGKFNGLVHKVAKVASGAGDKFAYIKIEREDGRDYRADRILYDQALRISNELKAAEAVNKPPRLFRGQSFDGFDGAIKEVDLRSTTKRCKLVLSDGTKELDCEFDGFTVEEIRDHLDSRVWAEGTATYNGESGMPVRLSIKSLRKITPRRDLAKWRSAVLPSDGDDWLD